MRRAYENWIGRSSASWNPAARPRCRMVACLAIAAGAAGLTGCQVDVGGQTLPSAYYLQDDIQYFPAGPEFKLSKEAAAQKAYKKEIGADGCGDNCGGCSHCGH
jgi:hypothetical protein